MTEQEFKDFMQKTESDWKSIELREWIEACEFAGIDFYSYSDSKKLWEDLHRATRK